MSFQIGFAATTESNEKSYDRIYGKSFDHTQKREAKKSVVEVYFSDRRITCSYYNDMFDLKRGDIVYVEGKLEGLRGRVVEVNYTFKIKLSDYKRVISVANTEVMGEFHLAGSHFITVDDGALNYEQIITWFKATTNDDEEFVSNSDDEIFNINDLKVMKIDNSTAESGQDYYFENRVVYIEIKSGKGRAIVNGRKPYEVEFGYKNGDISGLVCNCYCTGTCKHEFATMLQLRDLLNIIEKNYSFVNVNDYIAAVNKVTFFEYAIDSQTKGTFTIG